MNKKEIAEIKKNFKEDCGFFTVNRVVTAFVDSEKNIKCKTNRLYNIIPQEDSELIAANLKKVLSGRIGANLLEYAFPKDAYLEGGAQQLLYNTMKGGFGDDESTDAFLNAIVEKCEYVSTYTIFSAHCTYAVLNKNKMGELEEESDTNYNFIITALCPVNLRIDGLVYNEAENAIAKKESSDRIVEAPTDGFLFPLFNERMADVNGVLYYTKNAKKPNTTVIEDFLGCEFTMTGQSEKEVFHSILGNVVGDELDYDLITTVNDKIQTYIDQTAHETEVTTIDSHKLNSILWEAGVSHEKLENLDKVYENALGSKPMTAVNLVEKKTVVSVPSITVNIGKDAVDKVKTRVIDGRKCLVIALDDPEISINGLEMQLAPARETSAAPTENNTASPDNGEDGGVPF
ncbi:MAG: DUF4317 domain-containing protein [Ruminococcus sp.]|nr:DUF4317 domain-containing protein [Ruminococcus sp.]